MQLFHAARHSRQQASLSHDPLRSWSGEMLAQGGPGEMSSRHDPQLIVARRIPADPYAAWLKQREAERLSALCE